MSISATNLGQLNGFAFDNNLLLGLSVQSFQATGTPQAQTSAFVGLTATTTGPSNILNLGSGNPESFVVAGASSVTDVLVIDIYETIGGQQQYISTAYLNVIGYAANAILVASFSGSFIAHDLQLGNDTSNEIAALVIVPPPAGSTLSFAADGVYTGPAPCFALGTRIATGRGEIAVEALRAGDTVVGQVGGQPRRVVWVGRRTVEVAHHPRPWDVAPVRVRADAFAPGQPHRDLVLSPDHAVWVAGALIPIRYLLNGATIAREPARRVTYLHVELDTHDVLLAEGLPCESYLDTGNRGNFANGGPVARLYPDVAQRVWEAEACAPLVLRGPLVDEARRWLAVRARALGWRRTRRPALGVYADGRKLAAERCGPMWRVALPPDAGEVRLCSRASVPADLSATADGRRLGVALADVRLDGAPAPAACLAEGWHTPEAGWRWTDGGAVLRTGGASDLSFTVRLTETYWRRAA